MCPNAPQLLDQLGCDFQVQDHEYGIFEGGDWRRNFMGFNNLLSKIQYTVVRLLTVSILSMERKI
jgi:hypothetical protein